MLTLKFPKINEALSKNQTSLNTNSPRRRVIIVDNHAIVLSDFFCVVVNLYEYFTIDQGITEPEDRDSLTEILEYFNGKSFNKDYWAELVKGADVEVMENGNLFIKTPKLERELHYEDAHLDVLSLLEHLYKTNGREKMACDTIALNFKAMKTLGKCFGTELDTQSIVYEFSGQDRYVKFTFSRSKFIYGYVHTDYDAAKEGFLFHDLEQFCKDNQEMVEGMRAMKKSIPAPPMPQDNLPDVNDGLFKNLKVVKDADVPPLPDDFHDFLEFKQD